MQPAESIDVLTPTHAAGRSFPRKTAMSLGIAAVVGALFEVIGWDEAVPVLAALYLGPRLGAWLEQRWYDLLRGRALVLRWLGQVAFFALIWVPTALLVLILDKAQPYSEVLLIGVVMGGAWAAIAALGSAVVLVIDAISSATSSSFRIRVTLAVLSMLAVAVGTSLGLAQLAVFFAGHVNAANLGTFTVQGRVLPAEEALAIVRDPAMTLWIVFGVASVLLLPATVSAAVKFADAVMDRIHPMKLAFARLGEGDRRVRIEEGGSRDFKELAVTFNQMVSKLALAERMERAFGVYVSGHVLEKIRAQHGEAALPAALKDASVFFADIRGFTSISEKLSPERLVAMLNRYFEEAVAVIDAHDGYLNKFIGDALVVVFNGPLDQQDHAARAVRCAVALQMRVAELNRGGAFPEAGELRIGIGVATGPMTCGNVGSARQMEYTVIGDTVNLAARLTSHAGAGEVWINATAAAAIEPALGAEPLPMIKVKGKEAEVQPFRVPVPSPTSQAA